MAAPPRGHVTPIETIALDYLLWIHLLQNVVLAEWAPLLVVLGIPPALAARAGRYRVVRALTHPLVALPLWLATTPSGTSRAVYDAALGQPALAAPPGACDVLPDRDRDVVAGLPGRAAPSRQRAHGRSTSSRRSCFSAPLGLVLALVPDAVYDFYVDAPERLWGLSAVRTSSSAG